MPKFIINGGKRLSGEIAVSGAKNSALKIIPAAILSPETLTIQNLPLIEDVDRSLELLETLGADIKRNEHQAIISTKNIKTSQLDEKMADKFRGSIMFVGPLLARFGEAKFPHPGGCVIGAGERPIDLFLAGYKAFGAEIDESSGEFYHIKAKELKPANYFFPLVSVTATESMLMTAAIIPGKTILKNCAMEPEIEALAEYLNKQGAKISGAGSPTIIIEGTKDLKAGTFTVIPDRIETGSFAILAAAAQSEITITQCQPEHIMTLLVILEEVGVNFEIGPDWIRVKPNGKIKGRSIKTHEYPGFATDLQSPYVVLMTQAQGTCLIHETIYDRRLIWTDMLSQMGADITMCDPHRVVINGPTKLRGKHLISPDLRAGIALVIAGLIAEGETQIDNIYQIDRGYERLEERLAKIGADIKRVE
ncbi:UDP-N-acetylglucosamine 1-carboxyvinyltransferase [Candidatus Falkowbacteria bacterium]|jgi:UDP-N-acetylglucosamine 1-carboxyvinyltransferase|nr:UDP-N-acetylglucosamine 1-carboxyvinyltransferase [Patescibacteria group bacterium]MDD3435082.1 UDP-N-acetylglucosamine 1-carboxyvinyltransferase [Patescibacteria group bacterium]MDD4466516.1 UDP-N-acetylglucosamine 1-carboxyvinyltransferase [Patescibacteria group bacterium]NCU43171.1 UDP-N-acetylglucosamine 1-carboxyvinyltransferase [Candidatus Falkowbacteria bacterium]